MLEKSPQPEPTDSKTKTAPAIFAGIFMFVLLFELVTIMSDCSADNMAKESCAKKCYPLQIKVCDRHLVQCADDHIYPHQITAEKR